MRRGITRGEWLAFGAAVLVFLLIRLPLFSEPAVRLGWHSDAAAFGLMGRDMYEGTFHLFWWGQSYMGTLTSAFGALGGAIVAPFGVTPPVGPLGMRIGTAIEWVLMMFLYWIAMRVAFGPAVAIVTALLLATGPDWFFHSQLAPRGAEMLLLFSAAIFAVTSGTLDRKRAWFLFGLLSGFGWWMHQGVVFAIGGALAVVVLRSRTWELARPLSLAGFILLRGGPLPLRVVNAAILLILTTNFLRAFVPHVPAFFLYRPVLEPLAVWLMFRAVVAGGDPRIRAAARHLLHARNVWTPRGALFVTGALLGYAPVIAGGMFGAYENTYGFSAPLLSPDGIVRHVLRTLRSDFWILIGTGTTPMGIAISSVLVVLLSVHAVRHRRRIADLFAAKPGPWGPKAIAGAMLLLCFAFYFGSSRAYGGSVRYIAPAVPILFAFAVAEALAWWSSGRTGLKAAGTLAVAILTLGYALQRMELVEEIAAGRAEGRFFTGAGFSSGPTFDPRPTMAAIERGGYEVCRAHYAVGINLEWLLDRKVRFISHDSVEPRRDLARRLAAAPVAKCFVDWDGEVRPWDPREHDDSVGRTAAERLRRLRAGS